MKQKIEPISIKGSAELNKMFAAVVHTGSWLRRDFGEVENLQQSLTGAADFVSRAAKRIEESIISDLQLIRPSAGILTPNISLSGDDRSEFVLALSGAANFVRGNPRFAISLALRISDETKIGLIYSPIDDKLYYAEAGVGAYVFTAFHSSRINVSREKERMMMAINLPDKITDQGRQIRSRNDARITGCPALDMAWVAAGKFDKFISEPLDFAEIAAGELLVFEAGGNVSMDSELIASN